MTRLKLDSIAVPLRRGARAGWVLVAAAAMVTSGSSLAEDRPMRSSGGGADGRLTSGQLRHSDLLGAGDREEDVEALVRERLEAARRYIDVEAFEAALEEIEAADRLVPFHEDVMALLETIGQLRDGARQAGMELSRAEEARRTREARQAMERDAAARQARASEEVIERHGLPRNLEQALAALLVKQERLEERRTAARRQRERCIGAAARVHTHGAGRQCADEEKTLGQLRREERALDADLAVLSAAVRERHGQASLDRILDKSE